jgi:hypothetical protein
LPGVPNRLGNHALHPIAATRRPKSATRGVMPGISEMTMTAGPVPVTKTSWPLRWETKLVRV